MRTGKVRLFFIFRAYEELTTVNMKTVMDEARTEHFKGKVNTKFARDFGFKVKPCIAGRPRTKGKVETTMKLLDGIHAYQGKFNMEELHGFIEKLCNRVNHELHQGTGKIPILEYQKERNHLLQLPTERVRDSYRIQHKLVKVNASSMISYKTNQYSVPAEYQGKKEGLQVYEEQLWIYYNMKLIAQHKISEAKINYQEAHYKAGIQVAMPNYPDIDDLAKQNLKAIGEMYQ